jgi:hypothetical protein
VIDLNIHLILDYYYPNPFQYFHYRRIILEKKIIQSNSELETGNFHSNGGFASFCWWSSQTAARIELPNLLLPQFVNSTQIHFGIGMGLLWNVPANTAHKGFFHS